MLCCIQHCSKLHCTRKCDFCVTLWDYGKAAFPDARTSSFDSGLHPKLWNGLLYLSSAKSARTLVTLIHHLNQPYSAPAVSSEIGLTAATLVRHPHPRHLFTQHRLDFFPPCFASSLFLSSPQNSLTHVGTFCNDSLIATQALLQPLLKATVVFTPEST